MRFKEERFFYSCTAEVISKRDYFPVTNARGAKGHKKMAVECHRSD